MKRNFFFFDLWLMSPVLILIIMGLITLFSLNPLYARSQFFYVLFSLLAFYLFANIDYKIFKFLKTPLYIVSLILLIIVFIIGIESRGAVRWIDIFGIRIQFSELCKPFLSLALASFLANTDNRSFRSFFIAICLLLPVMLLILLQPDLGNALIYGGVAGIVLLVFGFPYSFFLAIIFPFLLFSPFLWLRLHEYQRKRLLTFINPANDPSGASYNVIQAIIAVGAGGFIGKGLSFGTQSGLKFLPERHTDFIFASLAEALGFLGAGIVILALFFLCLRLYIIFTQTNELFEKVFIACTFCFLTIHFFVNIGMNVGLIPVVGVTLPFVSYGGSSLLTNFIFLGIVTSIYRNHRQTQVLEIR